ncbi:MAG: transcriptional regulator YeiL [Lachnospiraceae bacterium]|nr:transcriptional regulator YeiL [Lachnospiraceae bacterium]
MKELQNIQELEAIWKQYSLQDYFSFSIRPYTRVLEFKSEELILEKNRKPDVLMFLFEGRAKVCLTDDEGRIPLIDFVESPAFLGEMELIGAQELTQSVGAITRCRCFCIDLKECRDQLLNDTRFLRRLCLFLGQKVRSNMKGYVRNQVYPLENRLATFILLTMHHSMYTEKHTEAAEYLGVTYRHLLYVLAKFRHEGILEKTPQGYKIRDLEALKALEIK